MEGWFLGNWLRQQNSLAIVWLAFQAQCWFYSDLYSPVQRRLLLAQTQQAVEMYLDQMSAGKILLLADLQVFAPDELA